MARNNWLNTTLLGIVIGMIAWFTNKGFDKIDTLNTTSIETRAQVTGMKTEMSEFKAQLGQMVTRSELFSELSKRDASIAELTREVSRIKRAP